MSRHAATLPPSYFEEIYEADSDPWKFVTSAYELAKYAATMKALPRERYTAAFEVGCSIGVLTEMLAARCDTVLAVDVADKALAQAAGRCADLANVTFARMQVPHVWPPGRFDLILMSEVVYYLDRHDLAHLVRCARQSIMPGGHIVLVHWTGETNYPLSGDAAAEAFIEQSAGFLDVTFQARMEHYRLDVLTA